jgi:hypothetical protein
MGALSHVPMRQRVVEVEADLGKDVTPRWRYVSGLLCGGRTVLTTAHVVQGAVTVISSGRAGQLPAAAVKPPGPDLCPPAGHGDEGTAPVPCQGKYQQVSGASWSATTGD